MIPRGGKGKRSKSIPRQTPWKLPWDTDEATVRADCDKVGSRDGAGPEKSAPVQLGAGSGRDRGKAVAVKPKPPEEPSDSVIERLEKTIAREWKERGRSSASMRTLPILGPDDDFFKEMVCAGCKDSGCPILYGRVQVYLTGKFLFACMCAPGTCSEAGRMLSPSAFEAHAGFVPLSKKSWRKRIWVKLSSGSDRFYLASKVQAFKELFKKAKWLKQKGSPNSDPAAFDDNCVDEDSDEQSELTRNFHLLLSDDSDNDEDLE